MICLNLATVIYMGLVFSNLVWWSDLIWAIYHKARKELWDRLVHRAIWWPKDPWLEQAKCIDYSFKSRATATSESGNDESRSRYWTSRHKPCWIIRKGTATSLPRHSTCPQEDQYLHLLGITHPITPFKLIPNKHFFLSPKFHESMSLIGWNWKTRDWRQGMGGVQSVDQWRRQLTDPEKQDRGRSLEYFDGLGVKFPDLRTIS